MDWLFEKPLFIVVMGLMTTAILAGVWLQTGRKPALYALLGTLGLTGALLLVERAIKTDREQIDALLHHIARHVERDDLDAALEYAHSDADAIRQQARAELSKYSFQRVAIKQNLEIQILPDAVPPKAKAEFNVMVIFSDRLGVFQNTRVPRFVSVMLLKEDVGWRIADYEHHDPRYGYTRR